ncbi:MAG: MerR family transcriptional regulator [Rhodococcus sp. (in: high G+C Gram-positive bacteria)]
MIATERATPELMTIGAFARATGLTPGALRFYSDGSILVPESTDRSSGYRYYSKDQIERAVTIRRLREIGMSLDKIAAVLAGDRTAIDQHVDNLKADAQRARSTAAELDASLHPEKGHTMITINGPVFATAVDQILTATAHHRDHPILAGVNLELSTATITLTATDRFRLSTRTLSIEADARFTRDAVVDGDDLRTILPMVRRHHRLQLSVGEAGVTFVPQSEAAQRCRVLADSFPDYRAMLDGLPPVVTRVVTSRNSLIRALEDHQHEFCTVAVEAGRVTVAAVSERAGAELAATVTGPDVELTFAMTTLYPALASAVGPEVMIDISVAHMPVVIRSADGGDLTTLAMPVDREAIGVEE